MGFLLAYGGLLPLQELMVARGNGAGRLGHIALMSEFEQPAERLTWWRPRCCDPPDMLSPLSCRRPLSVPVPISFSYTEKKTMRGQVLALVALAVAGLVAPAPAQAQTYKMEKVDIKGEGGTDYASVDAATNRVFVSRSTHVMVVEGATGKVLGDIPNTPGVHGVGIAAKAGHGFTANSGDQTVTMFDLKTLAVVKQITVGPGLDGVMYNEPDDKIILTNHSRPIGTLTAIDPNSGDIVATVELEDNARRARPPTARAGSSSTTRARTLFR